MENDNIFKSFTNDLTELISDISDNSFCQRFAKKQKINEFYYISNSEIIIDDYDINPNINIYINYNFQRKPYKKWCLKN